MARYSAADAVRLVVCADAGLGAPQHVSTWDLSKESARDQRAGAIAPGTRLVWTLDPPQLARLLVITVESAAPGADADGPPRLHLGSLEVLEGPAPLPLPGASVERSANGPAVDHVPKATNVARNYVRRRARRRAGVLACWRACADVRAQIKPLNVRHRQGRQVCDISVDPFRMQGFSLVCRQREGRPLSQVREVRVTVGTLSVRGDLVQENQLGVFLVPLVAPNTTVAFDKAVDVRGNVVTLECLSNYGDLEMCPASNFQLY